MCQYAARTFLKDLVPKALTELERYHGLLRPPTKKIISTEFLPSVGDFRSVIRVCVR